MARVKNHRKILISSILIVLLVLNLVGAVRITQPKEDVLSQVSSILEKVEEIRGLEFKEPPKIIVMTRAEARERFKPGKPDVGRMKLEEDVYKMSLLLGPNYPYVHEEVEQSLGWIAATIGDEIYIIKENFLADPDTARRVIAHESVHVLQRQWFNAPYGGPTLDTTKAIQAAIEGDADLVADLYCNESGIPIHKITDLYTRDPVTALGIFPYIFGDRFVAYLYKQGGWELVNSMYSNLPNTTKVVMFPELYFQNWTPVDVRSEVEKQLPENAKVRYSNRMGAYYVFLIYWGHDADRERALEAAKAWEGDWLVMGDVNESSRVERILVWKVVFSDHTHAADFRDFLDKITEENHYADFFSISLSDNEVTLVAKREVKEVKQNETETQDEVNLPDVWIRIP